MSGGGVNINVANDDFDFGDSNSGEFDFFGDSGDFFDNGDNDFDDVFDINIFGL